MTEEKLIPQDSKNMILAAIKLCGDIESLKIQNDEQYKKANSILADVKKSKSLLTANRQQITKPFKDKVGAIEGEYREPIKNLENAKAVISKAMGSYFQEKERRRIEEQRKLEAEAEEQRKKAESAAEREKAKAEKYRMQGREEMAEKAEARADLKADAATNAVAPVIEPKKLAGLSFRTDYEVSITEKEKAINALMANPMLSVAVTIDTGAIARICKAMKQAFDLPGIRIAEKKTPVNR